MSEKKALKALAKLQKAADKFNQAIEDFNAAYNPNSIGLSEAIPSYVCLPKWIDYNNEVISDLQQDIAEEFEEQ